MNIDFHSHTLPFADHGCADVVCARRQLSRAYAAGVDVLCVTPHFYPHLHNVASFLKKKEAGKAALATLDTPAPRLVFGAEVLLCEGVEEMEGLEELCFEGTKTLLLELPTRPMTNELRETLFALQTAGFTPILAHIERYSVELQEEALALCDRVQVNYSGLIGFFRKRFPLRLAKEGKLWGIGSDLHGDGDAHEKLPAVKKNLGEALYKDVMEKSASLLGL